MRPLFLAVALLLAAALPALAASAVTISSLAQSPASHYGQVVLVTGTIAGYEQKTTAKGNAYADFRLQGGGASVVVFAGRPKSLRNGLRVRVLGTFVKSKRIGRDTFRNAVEAIRIEILGR